MQLPATAARSRTRRAQVRRRNVSGLGFLTPFLVLYALFLILPLVLDVVMSLFNTSLVLPGLGRFEGLGNYRELFGDSRFWQAMWHTIAFTLVSTPPLVLIPLFFAIVVNRIRRGQWFFRLAFFLPYILPSAVIALIWTWLYEPGSAWSTGSSACSASAPRAGCHRRTWPSTPSSSSRSGGRSASTSSSTSPGCRTSRATSTKPPRSTGPARRGRPGG